ncbi:hypothetical protein D3C83_22100 [compost metagenome]
MSPLPSSCSAPLASRMVRESVFDETRKEIRDGRLALINPVMTSTDGRCVARMRWMPTARAICASRQIDSSTSLLATIIRSASSSMTTTTNGSGFGASGSPAPVSASTLRMLRLYCSMLRTPSAASVL